MPLLLHLRCLELSQFRCFLSASARNPSTTAQTSCRFIRGAFFRNKKKTKPNQPDYRGPLNYKGQELELAGWIKTSKSGDSYMSLEVKEKEPVGDETLLGVARNLYLAEYLDNHFNPAKPKQKGYNTTEERVNKFVNWIGEGTAVSHVTVEDYKKYVNSGSWAEKTRNEYGRSVRMFMGWCAKNGYGGVLTDWYIQTNPSLKMTKKRPILSSLRYAHQSRLNYCYMK